MEQIIRDFRPGNVIDTHQGTSCSKLYQFHDLNNLETEDKNQSSLVLAFRLNGLDFVMCGDADMTSEERIANRYPGLRCDVLKLSHHGSKTGSCDRFLDVLQPQLGIISSGAYSIYHHPSPETVQRLLKRHIPYLDTKEHGDISILMIGPLRVLITSDGFVDLL
jgi:beta-lactamase superfamily II metal-dependent hydrolase